eukprot:3242336-Amphidinium_carterae.1
MPKRLEVFDGGVQWTMVCKQGGHFWCRQYAIPLGPDGGTHLQDVLPSHSVGVMVVLALMLILNVPISWHKTQTGK